MSLLVELTPKEVRRTLDPAELTFASTANTPVLEGIIGQERATRAIEFGLEMRHPGYNIYAMGPSGAGKTSTITKFLQQKAATRPVPDDWGYVHNFLDPDRPCSVRMPAGKGQTLRRQVDALLASIAGELPKAFASDQYAEHRNALEREFETQRTARFAEMDAAVRKLGFGVVRGPSGLMVVPAQAGQALTEEQFSALSEADRQGLMERQPQADELLERALRQVAEIEDAARERLEHLAEEVAAATVAPLFARLLNDYAQWPDVVRYLTGIQAHIAAHSGDVVHKEQSGEAPRSDGSDGQPPWPRGEGRSPLDRYRLNVLVDNSGLTGAPVIVEPNPTFHNLIGRVELRAEFGTLVSNFRNIKPGALHRANGGYLVLDVRMLLRQPMAYDALKQALRHRFIRIEEMGPTSPALGAVTLTPDPIPLDIKVVLIGDPSTYYAIYGADEQFESLFKVRADFAIEMDWTPENVGKVAQFIRRRCEEDGLLHFTAAAVGGVVEYCAREVEDQRKLTTRFAHVSDILREASYWAGRAGHALVEIDDVRRAIEERIYRSNQFQERMQELIRDGTIMLDTRGAVVGQVNGLAVLQLGDYGFGKPSRITARTYQGRSGLINIEREARLSGRIHDKGVLILSGFLGHRYAQDKPLSLSASIAFEQSYDNVDGDSASSAELYALLSSLSELPLRQDLAVTGSVNQKGEIQPIGGANAKIEGFYDICRAAAGGLTGKQGVLLPATNVQTLMLREDVVEAIAQGQFHVYPVRTVDEGMELLTGVGGGERGEDGSYPPDSVNGRVDRKLRELAEQLQNFGRQPARGRTATAPAGEGEDDDQPPVEPGPPDNGEPQDEPDLPGDQPEAGVE